MRNFENKEKIMKASGVMQFICGWVAFMAFGQGVGIVLEPILHTILHQYLPAQSSPGLHATYWFWFKLPFSAVECIAWINLWIFFSRLKTGHIFDAPTVRRLANSGKLMLAGAVYVYVFDFLRFLLESPTANGPVQLGDETGALVGNLTAALAIILVAWLLREGQSLEEEQKLTV
jgi:hypothetical protein